MIKQLVESMREIKEQVMSFDDLAKEVTDGATKTVRTVRANGYALDDLATLLELNKKQNS